MRESDMFKTFKEIADELNSVGFQPTPPDCIDGYEFEDWLRKENDFITETTILYDYYNLSTVLGSEEKNYSYNINDCVEMLNEICTYKNYKVEAYELDIKNPGTDFFKHSKSVFSDELLSKFAFFRSLIRQTVDNSHNDDTMERAA
jgi:hypothetical protein